MVHGMMKEKKQTNKNWHLITESLMDFPFKILWSFLALTHVAWQKFYIFVNTIEYQVYLVFFQAFP